MPKTDEPRVGAGKGRPFYCPVCKHVPGAYFGRLVFENETEIPVCENHKVPQTLIRA